MKKLTQHTVSFIGNIKNLDKNLEELIEKFKSQTTTLEETEKELLISKKISEKLNEVYDVLEKAGNALSGLLNISYVGDVAKESHKSELNIREEIEQPKAKANELERKIRSYRNMLAKYRAYINTTVKALTDTEKFLKKEGQQADKTHKMNTKLPDSRYKNLSQERLNNSSELQIKLLEIPNIVVDKVIDLIAKIESNLFDIQKLCETAEKVTIPIQEVLSEANRIINTVDKINEALNKVLSVTYPGGKTALAIKKIITITEATTGIKDLTISAVDILEPLLKELMVNTVEIAGIGPSLESLEKAVAKLRTIEKDKNEIQSAISNFIDKNNPQETFDQVEEQRD